MSSSIPKIIHYCWFGRGSLPALAKKCIESWKKYLPEYEIREWNEDNFDVNMIPYTAEAYKAAVATIKEDNTIETEVAKGIANYIDSDKQIIITEIKTKEDMISEFTEYPDDYSALRNKYENSDKSYECVLNF